MNLKKPVGFVHFAEQLFLASSNFSCNTKPAGWKLPAGTASVLLSKILFPEVLNSTSISIGVGQYVYIASPGFMFRQTFVGLPEY